MRRALFLAAGFNFGAAVILLFPGSLGRLVNIPLSGSLYYSWMLAVSIGIFGGVYLWLAFRRQIDRPLIVVAIFGKLGVFTVTLACWCLGQIAGSVFLPTLGDLSFAAIFTWWLYGEISTERSVAAVVKVRHLNDQ